MASPMLAPSQPSKHWMHWLIIGLLSVIIIGLAVLFVKSYRDAKQARMDSLMLMGRLAALESRAMMENDGPTGDHDTGTPEDELLAWKTYSAKDFTFSYPETWTAKNSDSKDGFYPGIEYINVEFLNQKNDVAARLTCPLPETGYEAWDFTKESRGLSENNKNYIVTFMQGEPVEGSGLEPMNLLFMERQEKEFLGNSCQLTDWIGDQKQTFKKIYESVRIR